ncbi:MAG: DNA-binding protein WhiA [Culicoidibacterales bacterium]
MATFASQIKRELARLETKTCCMKAELAALIRINGTLSLTNRGFGFELQTENASTSRRIYSLIKGLYSRDIEILVRKKMKLQKNNVYILRVPDREREILNDLQLLTDEGFGVTLSPSLVANDCCKGAYLRGAYLASGSVNDPKRSNYHLEVYVANDEHAVQLAELSNHFNLNAKVTARKKGFIMYIKEAEKIADFIGLIGATTSLFEFEDIRITRDMRNSVNRVMNCELANVQKSLNAAEEQIHNIKLVYEHIGRDRVSEKLQIAGDYRIENPDLTLGDLAELLATNGYPVSKSGLNHRFRKLADLAKPYQVKAVEIQ